MKVVWEKSDIKVGRKYGKPGTDERMLIGYRVDVEAQRGDEKKFIPVSLSDGQVCCEQTAEQFAGMLTAQGYVPAELLS